MGLSQISYEAALRFCLDGPFVKSLDFSRDLVSECFCRALRSAVP